MAGKLAFPGSREEAIIITLPVCAWGIAGMKGFDNETLQEIKEQLFAFFPDSHLDETQEGILSTQKDESILFRPEKILPYLQTIFFEEHLVEIQIDQYTRAFFAHLLDDLPALAEHEEKGEISLVEPEYEPGSYLKKMESFLLTPLTPGIGNALVRSSRSIRLRYFAGTIAIELGCVFHKQDVVRDIPVLRFHFPVIGRITRNYRLYRVKTVSTVEAYVVVTSPIRAVGQETRYEIVDISVLGVAFQLQGEKSLYEVGERLTFTIVVKDFSELSIAGNVRRLVKVREKHGYRIIYGIQFDLETRALAAEIEQLVAAIQRLQLRELSKRISDLRGIRLIR